MKRYFYACMIFLVLIFLFLFPQEGVSASYNGLMLWFQTILPTLLPFMILSNMLISLHAVSHLTTLFYPILHFFFGVSKNGAYALMTGYLCGYPMGAKITADLTEHQLISPKEGQYLLGFCNNVSPMFIITYVAVQSFHNKQLILPSVLILYGSALIYGLLTRNWKHSFRKNGQKKEEPLLPLNFKIVDASIMNSFETITKLGGYIVLFAILAAMCNLIPFPSELFHCILIGLCEITNGVQAATASGLTFPVQYCIVLTAVAFGGLSGLAQTASMIKDSPLSLSRYLIAKLITGLLTLAGCILFLI